MPELALLKLPAVESAFQTVSALYAFGKGKSTMIPFLPGVIDTTEKTVCEAAERITPLLHAHSDKIIAVDAYATPKVEAVVATVAPYVEKAVSVKDEYAEKAAAVKETVEARCHDTKRTVTDTILAVETAVERSVAPTVALTATLAESVVDAVLPEPAPADAADETDADAESDNDGDAAPPHDEPRPAPPLPAAATPTPTTGAAPVMTAELAEALSKCNSTVSKAKRRAYLHAFSKLATVQTRTESTVERFKEHAVDLIGYAQSMVRVETDMVDVHREAATAAAESIAAATAAYVTQQRELLAAFARDPVSVTRATVLRTIARGDAIHHFVREQFDRAASREAFVHRMQQLQEQARAVRAVVLEGVASGVSQVRTVELVAKAEALYWEFEDAADPYTLSLLKRLRIQLGRVTGVTPGSEAYVVVDHPSEAVEDDVDTPPDGAAAAAAGTPTYPLDESFGTDDDLAADEGLVLRISTYTVDTSSSRGSDIDHEDVLPPDAGDMDY